MDLHNEVSHEIDPQVSKLLINIQNLADFRHCTETFVPEEIEALFTGNQEVMDSLSFAKEHQLRLTECQSQIFREEHAILQAKKSAQDNCAKFVTHPAGSFLEGTSKPDAGISLARLMYHINCISDKNKLLISNITLKSIPEEIGLLTNLTDLGLINLSLKRIPVSIAALTNLTFLDLGNNLLTTLPLEMECLVNLEELDLSYNKFSIFPAVILKLPKLKKLHLQGNPFDLDVNFYITLLGEKGVSVFWHDRSR